ncbi:hypothetical protein [Ureibacillus chungkukjangi]|uniref:hypothetical protein n=1 Tax=Ureibacillus chungkukjangi TaxID=1202712 RepID=UPI0015E8BCD7|nr:hypothetical protein [Ureibacillus chungkukjangi]
MMKASMEKDSKKNVLHKSDESQYGKESKKNAFHKSDESQYGKEFKEMCLSRE